MARWSLVTVTLSAGQAAGSAGNPILAAESAAVGCGTRKLLSVTSRSAAACDLFFVPGGVAGAGIPIAAGARIDFSTAPPFDGELYIVGATAAEKVVLHLA